MKNLKNIHQMNFVFVALFILFLPFKTHAILVASDTLYLYENNQQIKDNSVILDNKICYNGVCDLTQLPTIDQEIIFYKTAESNLLEYTDWASNGFLKSENCMEYITYGWDDWWKKWTQQTKASGRSRAIKEEELKLEPQRKLEITNDLWSKRIIFMLESGDFNFYLNSECKEYFGVEKYDKYIQNYINNAIYSTKINIPQPNNKETKNGMVGTGRCFNVDIKTKEIKEIACPVLDKSLETKSTDKYNAKSTEEHNVNLISKTLKQYLVVIFIILLISMIIIFLKKRNNKNIK